jgi:hypothetical protein
MMANESAVENISDLKTSETCAGCGEEINLLMPHLRVGITPARSVIETVDAALVGAETDESGNIVALAVDVTDPDASGERERFYVGVKLGASEGNFFHNYEHLANWAMDKAEDQEFQAETGHPTIKRFDVDPQAAERSNE